MRLKYHYLLIGIFWLSLNVGCSSTPDKPAAPLAPEWTREPVRIVDNGYIVYVESESGPNEERAKFKAEGLALADLANECSFIPKGARIEDRYIESGSSGPKAYIKLAVEFQDCTEAQKANDPESVRRIASESFMQSLKAYQDFQETGDVSYNREPIDADAVADLPVPPPQQGSSDNIHFYVLRQYVAYQKEVVILSPSTSFAPQSTEAQTFASNINPVVQRIGVIQAAQPGLAKEPVVWSKIPDRPKFSRPLGLVRKQPALKTLNVPRKPLPQQPQRFYPRRNGHGNKNPKRPNEKDKEYKGD